MPFENLDKFVLDSGDGYEAGDGVDSENGVVMSDAWNNLFTALSGFMGFGFYDGSDCADKASGAASCEIYLMVGGSGTVAQRKVGAVAGQKCRVHYTTGGNRYIFLIDVQEDAGSPYIQFDSNDVHGRTAAEATAAIPDYSNAAFIDALNIFVADEFPAVIADEDLLFQHDAPGTLLGTDIATDNSASDKIGTEFDATQTTVDAGLTSGTGVSKAGKVISTSLDKTEALSDDSPINMLLDGSTRDFLYGQDIAFGLTKYGLATSWAEETTIIPYAGKSSQEFVAAGSDVGISAELAGDYYPQSLRSKNVTVTAWVYSSVQNNVKIGINDGGLDTDTPAVAATTWTKISFTADVGAGATSVVAVILASGAGTIYVTDINMFEGDTAFTPVPSMETVVIHHNLDNQMYNDFLFGDCAAEDGANDFPGHAWLNGVATAPFPWNSATLGGTYAQEKTDFHSANASISATFAAGEGLQTFLGLRTSSPLLLQKYLGKSCTFSCFLLKDGANTRDIDLEIATDGTGGTTTRKSFDVNSYATWQQVSVTLDTVPTDATYIRVRVMNNDAGAIACFLDSFSITQTEHPVAFSTLTPWQYHSKDFTYAGSQPSSATAMDAQGGLAIAVPAGVNMWLYGATVFQGTSAAGNDLYYAFTEDHNGAAWVATNWNGSFTVTLGNSVDYASAADTDGVCPYITSGSRVGMKVDGDAMFRGSDAFGTLHFLTWGI